MRPISHEQCHKCPGAKNINHGICNGKDILVILESSDERALRRGYETELFASGTGRTLKKILGPEISRTAITNSVKCLFGRPPKPVEFENCAPHTRKLITRMRPKIVLALGNWAKKVVEKMPAEDLKIVRAPHPRRMTIKEKEKLAKFIKRCQISS